MLLYASPTSPYARLVRAAIIEKELTDAIEMAWVNPWESPETLQQANPFCQVPCLQPDDGEAVVDSVVILAYLESYRPAPALLSAAAYRKLGLGKVLIDAAVDVVVTQRIRQAPEDDEIRTRRLQAIARSLPVIAAAVPDTVAPDVGDLAVCVALEYLDFRLPDIDWRAGQPGLARWQQAVGGRPSLAQTRPE